MVKIILKSEEGTYAEDKNWKYFTTFAGLLTFRECGS